MHNSHKHPWQFEDVREKIEDLVPLLEGFKQIITTTVIDGDQAEKKRRSDLSRYACRFLSVPTINGLRSALEDIEKQSSLSDFERLLPAIR